MLHQPVRILVTGSRTWTDKAAIAQAISDHLLGRDQHRRRVAVADRRARRRLAC